MNDQVDVTNADWSAGERLYDAWADAFATLTKLPLGPDDVLIDRDELVSSFAAHLAEHRMWHVQREVVRR